jgi:hypothetical protein
MVPQVILGDKRHGVLLQVAGQFCPGLLEVLPSQWSSVRGCLRPKGLPQTFGRPGNNNIDVIGKYSFEHLLRLLTQPSISLPFTGMLLGSSHQHILDAK